MFLNASVSWSCSIDRETGPREDIAACCQSEIRKRGYVTLSLLLCQCLWLLDSLKEPVEGLGFPCWCGQCLDTWDQNVSVEHTKRCCSSVNLGFWLDPSFRSTVRSSSYWMTLDHVVLVRGCPHQRDRAFSDRASNRVVWFIRQCQFS